MDRGAHFFCCDFQVHTPRDRGWEGARPTLDTDRAAFADRFIGACRDKGLDAVAITDHHDLAFFPFIRDAAKREKDSEGNNFSPEKQIIIFPGMELTLALPCQALLIFDADLHDDILATIPHHLGLPTVDLAAEMGPNVAQLEQFTDFQLIYKRLNENPMLKGRFIVLPHVQDGGYQTLLRSHFQIHYKNMPCVGGYVDGSIERLGEGNKKILNGENADYGNKPLGVFQTSDSRQEDFASLGTHTTWVKWTKPTAEALRQACLAKKSRISQSKPQSPSIQLCRIAVSDSAFLKKVELELNPYSNAFIGGRGTGKSSLLEYARWALCDQPVELKEEESGDIPNYAKKREILIKKTLEVVACIVQVDCKINGVLHSARRNSESGEIHLRIGTGTWIAVTEENVREKIPIQAYSQKQLSNVAVLPTEIQRLVKAEILSQADNISNQLHLLADSIKEIAIQKDRKENLEQEISSEKQQADSIRAQIQKIRGELAGLTADEKNILSVHDYSYLSH